MPMQRLQWHQAHRALHSSNASFSLLNKLDRYQENEYKQMWIKKTMKKLKIKNGMYLYFSGYEKNGADLLER
jgi:hypothetical protein